MAGSLALSLPLALLSTSAATAASIWHVSIDNGPAPSPDKGPPLSVNASRDRSLLPIQIGSIFGAYFLSVLVVGIAILLVGHRLRRAAQASPRTLDMEMVKPRGPASTFDPSPVSPRKNRPFETSPISVADSKLTWPSPDKAKGAFNWPSPTKGQKHASKQGSVVTFDENVIEDDKAKGQREMERLYAAVMEHDAQSSTVVYDANHERLPDNPPELQYLRQPASPPRQQPISPPPTGLTTASPPRHLPPKASKPSALSISGLSTHSRASSRTSLGSFSNKRGIRSLPISPPMGSPDLAHYYGTSAYGDEEPLSPRYHDPGPPPPPPGQTQRFNPGREPTSPPRTFAHHPPPPSSPPPSQPPLHSTSLADAASKHADAEAYGPQRLYTRRQPAALALPLRSHAALGPTLTPTSTTPTTLTIPPASSSTLHHPHHHLPLRTLTASSSERDRPRSTIKATVLDRPATHVHALRSAGGVAVPATPYSPYMPFTPLTPITPRLVTREERRRRERGEGRRVLCVEDRVLEEGEIWGDGYS